MAGENKQYCFSESTLELVKKTKRELTIIKSFRSLFLYDGQFNHLYLQYIMLLLLYAFASILITFKNCFTSSAEFITENVKRTAPRSIVPSFLCTDGAQ